MEKIHLFFMPQQNQLSESGDCMSSSEDAPETETGEQDSMSAKKKQETELQEPGCSELQEDIQCPGDPQNMVEKNHEETTDVVFQCSDQKLQLTRLNQLETVTSGKQTDTLMADTSRFQEFQHGQAAVREDGPCKALENARRVRSGLPEKETNPQGSKTSKSKHKC